MSLVPRPSVFTQYIEKLGGPGTRASLTLHNIFMVTFFIHCYQSLARMFVTVGMSQQAVEAFTKANLIQEAIDSCVSLNQVQLSSLC